MLQKRQQQDRERIDTIVKVANGILTQTVAGKILNIKPRQVRRLVEKYKSSGATAMLHQGRGKPSNNRSDDSLRSNVLDIILARYLDSGPTLISDELSDLEGIEVIPETIRRWMIRAGFWTVSSKGNKEHRRWRERKACRGEMIQMDTSVHDWFDVGSDHKFYCIAMIDDATSDIFLRFYDADSTVTNMDLIYRYMRRYGRPVSLYTDKASHFTDNPPKGFKRPSLLDEERTVTQIQRAMAELDIRMIIAHSAQAKGRVERLFNTLQDRLLLMMKHRGIKTIEEANAFVDGKFLSHWRDKFTRQPLNATDVHRSVEGFDLDSIMSVQVTRIITNDYTFQYGGFRYQIESQDSNTKMRRKKIVIEKRLDGSLKAKFEGENVHFHLIGRI
jgi:hypothetical protein